MKGAGYKNFFRFMVLVLGILFANLVTMWMDNFMLSYKGRFAPYVFTWIGLAIIAIIYYPLFTRVDKWATKLGDKYMKIGKKVAGKEIGSIVAFVAGLFALFYFYGKEWFNTNVFSSLIKAVGKWFS